MTLFTKVRVGDVLTEGDGTEWTVSSFWKHPSGNLFVSVTRNNKDFESVDLIEIHADVDGEVKVEV